MTIRFDDAWAKALEVAKQAAVSTHLDVVALPCFQVSVSSLCVGRIGA